MEFVSAIQATDRKQLIIAGGQLFTSTVRIGNR
jgi:hypothetical protein